MPTANPQSSRRKRLSIVSLAITGAAAGCSPFGVLNLSVPAWGYRQSKGHAYGDEPRQKLDVYRPGKQAAGAPMVVFLYGGGWRSGDRRDYRFAAEAFTSRGYVTVIPDYRLYPNVTFPAFVEDAAKAVKWATEHAAEFGADPKRIYLVGHSAGAHIVTLLAMDETYLREAGVDRSTIRAVGALAGPYDLVAGGEYAPAFMRPGTTESDPLSAPIARATGDGPPLLLIQGTRDSYIAPRANERMAEVVREKGGRATAITYRNGSHADNVLSLAWWFRWVKPTLRDLDGFFKANP